MLAYHSNVQKMLVVATKNNLDPVEFRLKEMANLIEMENKLKWEYISEIQLVRNILTLFYGGEGPERTASIGC